MKIIGIGEVVWDCFPEGKELGAILSISAFTKKNWENHIPRWQ